MKNSDITLLRDEVGQFFSGMFGETPITQRLNDIFGEALELKRYTTLKNIREEAGDLLASLLSLMHEANLDPIELLEENKAKILRRKEQYATLGRKTRVAILGGAFNPIHNSHIALAQFVLDTSKHFDKVWLLPCAEHMYGKQMVPADHRLAMCKLAAQADLRIEVSDFEIARKLAGETYQTAKMLNSIYHDRYEFAWIIGMDNANDAPSKWVNFGELERMMPFVVVPRKGEKRNPKVNWYLASPHIYLEPDNFNLIPSHSSTKVRELLYADSSVDKLSEMVATEVEKYIKQHHLY